MVRGILKMLFVASLVLVSSDATPIIVSADTNTNSYSDDAIVFAYDVSDIVRKTRHFPAPKLGLQGIEEAEDPFDDDDDEDTTLSVDDLVDLIKKTVAPGTWDDGPHSITSSGTVIFITIDPNHKSEVAAALGKLRGKVVKPVIIEARIVALTATQLTHLGFTKKVRSRLMAKSEAEKLLEPVLEDAKLTLGAPRITAWENQRCHSVIVTQSTYIADAKLDEATGTVDPVIEILNEGITFEVLAKPRSRGKKMLLEWTVTLAHRAESQFEETEGGVFVELPRIEKSISQGRGLLRSDQLLLVRGLRSLEIGDGEGVLILSWERPKETEEAKK